MGWSFTDEVTPKDYVDIAGEWLRLRVRVVGGCCGTTPAHIRELTRASKEGTDSHEDS